MMKKIPMRMCVGCGEMQPKKTLVRIVKSSEGEIHLDTTGKMPGRGAYLCKRLECLEHARRTHRLERSFSCRVDASVYEVMMDVLSKTIGSNGDMP